MFKLIILVLLLIIGYVFTTKYDYVMSLLGKKKINDEKKIEEKYEEINTDDVENFFESEDNNSERFVYLDVKVDKNVEKIVLELKPEVVPKTTKNFIELCKQKKYNNVRFHRVIKDFMIQGGDITNNNGTGGNSIYGDKFEDENFDLPHKRGVISMANSGPNTNGSQFFITVKDTEWLNGKHTVFGEVIKGMDIVDKISQLKVNDNSEPLNDIVIVDCGIYSSN